MPRYLTSHNMACMTRQGVRQFVERLRASPEAGFLRLLVNLTEGQLIGEFEVPSRETLRGWMEKSGIHYEWMARMDIEATRDEFRDL